MLVRRAKDKPCCLARCSKTTFRMRSGKEPLSIAKQQSGGESQQPHATGLVTHGNKLRPHTRQRRGGPLFRRWCTVHPISRACLEGAICISDQFARVSPACSGFLRTANVLPGTADGRPRCLTSSSTCLSSFVSPCHTPRPQKALRRSRQYSTASSRIINRKETCSAQCVCPAIIPKPFLGAHNRRGEMSTAATSRPFLTTF
jgi:hypothetical protein